MNEELYMELADCGSPEGLAQIIHDHIPFTANGSADLEAIANAVGITKIEETDSSAYEGLLITDSAKSEGYILYNKNSNPGRRRFTISHEIGHFLLPLHNKNAQCASSDMKNMQSKGANSKTETEANRFAIELLAPKKAVKASLKSKRTPDIQQIFDIHKRFKISKEAAARRYIECTDHNVAIIFGKGKMVRYVLRVEDFPYLSLQNGEALPEHIAQQIDGKSSGDEIDWYCVDPEYFLSRPSMARGMELFCQTVVQDSNFHISLLSLEEE